MGYVLEDFTDDPFGRPNHYALKASLDTDVLHVFVTRADQTLGEFLSEIVEECDQAAAYATLAIADATGLDPSAIDVSVGAADDQSTWSVTLSGASPEQEDAAAVALEAFEWFDPGPALLPYVAFEARWTEDELAALHAAKAQHWQVERLYTRAVVQGHVNLSGEMAATAKTLFVSLGILAPERADVIFAP